MKYKKTLIICIILLIIDISLVLTGTIKPIDEAFYQLVMTNASPGIAHFLTLISFFASTKFIIIVNLIIFIIIIITKKNELLLITVNSIISSVVNNILKLIIARPRPGVFPLVTEKFYSFPSGHSMISVLTYGTILYLINKSNIKHKHAFNIIIPIFIVLVGVSRVFLGVHYISDCIGGYLVSIIVLIVIINIKERKNEGTYNRRK